jgi:hypothetical protein
MTKSLTKKLTSKIAKQFGGYNLIKMDLVFCAYSFFRAANLAAEKLPKRLDDGDFMKSVMQALEVGDPVLRAGGNVTLEHDNYDVLDQDRRAFFEAGIVAYAKCFNTSMRTRLSDGIFRGPLHPQKALHVWMMQVRNEHIAHSELRLERSYAGIQLVDDQNYGKRPSGILMAIVARRNVPRADRLMEMYKHCDEIIKHYLDTQITKTGREIREQMLKLPKEQFDALPDYFEGVDAADLPDPQIWQERPIKSSS